MILYKDDALCVVNKPTGILVHPRRDSLREPCLLKVVRNRINRFLYPVHRLDRGTSGVMVFALSPEAARRLARQFESGNVRKIYWAVCRGHTSDQKTFDQPLSGPSGIQLTALTDLKTLARSTLPVCVDRYPVARYSLVEVIPYTGRFHQIRRHLARNGNPVIGDGQHGACRHNQYFARRWEKRLLLFSRKLSFTHPLTGQRCCFAAPVDPSAGKLFRDFGWQSFFGGSG